MFSLFPSSGNANENYTEMALLPHSIGRSAKPDKLALQVSLLETRHF